MLKKLLINFSLISLSVIFTILLIEFGLRLFGLSIERPLPSPPLRNYFIADYEMGADIKRNVKGLVHELPDGVKYPVWSNSLGCFDKPYLGEEKFIYLTGDSFAFGWAPLEKKWGTIIENELGIRVLKCGGFAEAKIQLIKCKRVLKEVNKIPKLIIVSYQIGSDLTDRWGYHQSPVNRVRDGYLISTIRINPEDGDITILSEREINYKMNKWKEKQINKESNFLKLKRWFSFNSFFYNYIRDFRLIQDILSWAGLKFESDKNQEKQIIWAFMQYVEPSNGKFEWLKRAWDQHLDDLKMFNNYAISIGSQLLYVLIPPREAVYDFLKEEVNRQIRSVTIQWDRPNNILKEFFRKNNINYIDLTPLFKERADQRYRKELDYKKDFYYKFDGHWNENGDRLAGLLIAKYIFEQGLIKVSEEDIKRRNIEKSLSTFAIQ
jgi:hypothetical protein